MLWPSNLPALGSAVSVWPDLSGKGNDAKALNPEALPAVVADGVKLIPGQPGAGFAIENGASLDFAAEDFVVVVVSGLKTAMPATFFLKSDLNRDNPRQIALASAVSSDPTVRRPQGRVNATTINAGVDLPQPSVNVYALRRTDNHEELRVNGVVLGSGNLANATESTTNADGIFLGVSSPSSPAVDTLEGAFAMKGAINSGDLSDLETFLRLTLSSAP
ncbi:MAG: hypothetical protein ABJA82_04240 [Myxococcales bacterium]